MVFPSAQLLLSEGLRDSQHIAIQLKVYAIKTNTVMAAGSVSANVVLNVMSNMKDAIIKWNTVRQLPGMAQYAKDQFNNQNIDIVAEFTTMREAAIEVRDWVIATFPKSAGGFIERVTLESDGSITTRSFTPIVTAPLRTRLDVLIATIG